MRDDDTYSRALDGLRRAMDDSAAEHMVMSREDASRAWAETLSAWAPERDKLGCFPGCHVHGCTATACGSDRLMRMKLQAQDSLAAWRDGYMPKRRGVLELLRDVWRAWRGGR